MKTIRNILVIFVLCLPLVTKGQTHDVGAILSAEYEKKIVDEFRFGAEGLFQFNQKFTNFDQLRVGAGFDYSFWKKRFKIATMGYYILNDEGSYFENRGRIQTSFSYTERIQQFRIGLRARVQSTFYDECHGEHKFNPKTYFRGRLQLEYEFFSKPVKMFASTEFYLRLYKKGDYFIDNFCTIVGCTYRLTQGSSLYFAFRSENDIQVKNPENVYYICIGYNFKH